MQRSVLLHSFPWLEDLYFVVSFFFNPSLFYSFHRSRPAQSFSPRVYAPCNLMRVDVFSPVVPFAVWAAACSNSNSSAGCFHSFEPSSSSAASETSTQFCHALFQVISVLLQTLIIASVILLICD